MPIHRGFDATGILSICDDTQMAEHWGSRGRKRFVVTQEVSLAVWAENEDQAKQIVEKYPLYVTMHSANAGVEYRHTKLDRIVEVKVALPEGN